MEDAKLLALHDTLSKLRKGHGLGAERKYSWQTATTKRNDGPPSQGNKNSHHPVHQNPLYAYFHREGEYKRNGEEDGPATDGDGRVIKRTFDDMEESDDPEEESEDDPSETTSDRKRKRKEARKAEKKAEKKAAKLEAKRQAKLDEKRRAKREAATKQGDKNGESAPADSESLSPNPALHGQEDLPGSVGKTATSLKNSAASSNPIEDHVTANSSSTKDDSFAKSDSKKRRKEAKKRARTGEEVAQSSGEGSATQAPREASVEDQQKDKKKRKKKSSKTK